MGPHTCLRQAGMHFDPYGSVHLLGLFFAKKLEKTLKSFSNPTHRAPSTILLRVGKRFCTKRRRWESHKIRNPRFLTLRYFLHGKLPFPDPFTVQIPHKAEEVGFEPTVQFPRLSISSRVPSTTQPLLRTM